MVNGFGPRASFSKLIYSRWYYGVDDGVFVVVVVVEFAHRLDSRQPVYGMMDCRCSPLLKIVRGSVQVDFL